MTQSDTSKQSQSKNIYMVWYGMVFNLLKNT